jgi:hypothetical protein
MGLELANYEERAHEAVKAFWGNRAAAIEKQKLKGKVDQGERAGVTAGKNMDGFVTLLVDLVEKNGLKDAEIHLKRQVLTLPGYFRPTKLWDVLITRRGKLIAALELKSHIGPSFGNNFNNRTEEALGTALDLWTAFREGAFGKEEDRPFVGWLMLVEDCRESSRPVECESPHFPLFEEFLGETGQGASYLQRYDILCRRLIQEQLYTVATVIATPRAAVDTGEYREFSQNTTLKAFITSFAGHIAIEAAKG